MHTKHEINEELDVDVHINIKTNGHANVGTAIDANTDGAVDVGDLIFWYLILGD